MSLRPPRKSPFEGPRGLGFKISGLKVGKVQSMETQPFLPGSRVPPKIQTGVNQDRKFREKFCSSSLCFIVTKGISLAKQRRNEAEKGGKVVYLWA